MPVREGLIQREGVPFIRLAATDTVQDALSQLSQTRTVAQTVIVVEDNQFIHCGALLHHASLIGESVFDEPLAALPLQQPWRIVPADTSERGPALVEQTRNRAGSVLLVTDQSGHVIGVFTGTLRAGGGESAGVKQLHGVVQKLYENPHLSVRDMGLAPPQCPVCGDTHFLRFDPARQVYICPETGKDVPRP